MSKENILVLSCGALWLIAKTVLHNFITHEENVMAGVMLNLLLILVVAVYAIRTKVKATEGQDAHFLDDLKSVLRATSKYVLLSIIALGVFNYGIAGATTAAKEAEYRRLIEEQYGDPENYAELQANNFQLENVLS